MVRYSSVKLNSEKGKGKMEEQRSLNFRLPAPASLQSTTSYEPYEAFTCVASGTAISMEISLAEYGLHSTYEVGETSGVEEKKTRLEQEKLFRRKKQWIFQILQQYISNRSAKDEKFKKLMKSDGMPAKMMQIYRHLLSLNVNSDSIATSDIQHLSTMIQDMAKAAGVCQTQMVTPEDSKEEMQLEENPKQ